MMPGSCWKLEECCKEQGQLAEDSKEGLDSKWGVVPMMMMMMMDAELNLVSDSLNAELNSTVANVISEITKENDRMRQEFSTQLLTEVQSLQRLKQLREVLIWN